MSGPPPIERPTDARPRRDAEDEIPAGPDRAEREAIERGQARLVELGGARRTEHAELGATVLSWPGRGPTFNHATCLRWDGSDWQARTGAMSERLAVDGEVPCLVVSEGLTTPPDLAERLASAGWLELGGETVMWTRRAAAVPHLEGAIRLEAVTVAHVETYEAIERSIFGLSDREADDRRQALVRSIDADGLRVYLVREDGRPVATARLFVEDGLAAVHGLGVVADARRRGLGAYLTTIVTRAGLALGASLVWLSVDPENTAAVSLYAGLDYRPTFAWRRFLAVD